MAHDSRIVELINADIDGEISSADKAELESLLAGSAEAQGLQAELQALSASLDSLPDLDSPPHLKHTIMASIPQDHAPQHDQGTGFLATLIAAPALRYAAMFATGAILTLSLVSSDQLSQNAFNEVTGLVGTISNEVPDGPGIQAMRIERQEVVGTVTLRSSGQLLVIDFDLVSSGPLEIIASYADQTIWFNGFAQLQSPGASISAQSGRVTMQIDGKRRYAIFLHRPGDRAVTIKLQFISNGESVYDTVIEYAQPGQSG